MNEKNLTVHVTKEQLDSLLAGQLCEEERIRLLGHVSGCSYCAELFADCLEESPLTPPLYLREEILERSRCMDVRTVRTVYGLSRQMRLLLYGLKVGLAVAVSLFLLFSSSNLELIKESLSENRQNPGWMQEEPVLPVTEKLNQGSDFINRCIQEISGWLPGMRYEEDWND